MALLSRDLFRQKRPRLFFSLILLITLPFFLFVAFQVQDIRKEAATQIGIWDKFEGSITNTKTYTNPYSDVTLNVVYTKPNGTKINFWGFYDDNATWKFRYMPDTIGIWSYTATFSDGQPGASGTFDVVPSQIPGMISNDDSNPMWFGYKGGKHVLIRSFHVGDKYFNLTWPASERTAFLNWAQEKGYNTLSIASHYLKRDSSGRGAGMDIPDLWDKTTGRPQAGEFRRIEPLLNDLARRGIHIFPFAGFFGQSSDFPTDHTQQELYLRYMIARFGSYWNMMFNVAGPEPLTHPANFQNAMTHSDINRLGELIAQLDPFDHSLTIHNGQASSISTQDVFKTSPWSTFSTIQGPDTTSLTTFYTELASVHHPAKPLYAQETLWSNNQNQTDWTDSQIRKFAYVIHFASAAINFADNGDPTSGANGNSSSGFSMSMIPSQAHTTRHTIINNVWNILDDFEFWRMKPRQDLTNTGFLQADPGRDYLLYLDTTRSATVTVTGGPYYVTWINAQNGNRTGSTQISSTQPLTPPSGGDDWLLSLSTASPTLQPTLSSTPTQTITPTQDGIRLSFKLFLHGIGKAGDNAAPGTNGNLAPLTPQRTIQVEVYDGSNSLVSQSSGVINFIEADGNFTGTINAGNLPSGAYTIRVKSDKYLFRYLPGIITLTQNQVTQLPTQTLIVGDSNNDNLLNILDYNLILDCYSELSTPRNCDPAKKAATDLTDDGNVNQFDYNLLLRELSVQSGQ